jgi:hypothetical protein
MIALMSPWVHQYGCLLSLVRIVLKVSVGRPPKLVDWESEAEMRPEVDSPLPAATLPPRSSLGCGGLAIEEVSHSISKEYPM